LTTFPPCSLPSGDDADPLSAPHVDHDEESPQSIGTHSHESIVLVPLVWNRHRQLIGKHCDGVCKVDAVLPKIRSGLSLDFHLAR